MRNKLAILIFSVLFSSAYTISESAASTISKAQTFVMVHGVTGGAWDWKGVAQHLEDQGHTAYRATLTGLGERHHLLHADINLTTHINDVVNLILFEDLQDVVLVGHSYGGMVITGVMDRIPERLSHVVFLDAAAPDDGMSATDVWGPKFADQKIIDGIVHFSWLDPHGPVPKDVPHPLKTLYEPVSYKNPLAKKLDVTFVAFVVPGKTIAESSAGASIDRVRARGWTLRSFSGDHVIYREKPAEMAALLIESISDRNQII